jgi:hypothetical protein
MLSGGCAQHRPAQCVPVAPNFWSAELNNNLGDMLEI